MGIDMRALGSINTNIRGVFLAYMVVAAVLALFFLLYFNRVIASLASWALRTWTWHRYGIYIDVQAIQFSLLGGRIFFVGLRYHGNNETILVQNGHITWSYWLRRVRHIDLGKRRTGKAVSEDDLKGDRVHQESKTKSQLPCRLNVNFSGLEWFVYNRSAAYDSIVAGLADMNSQLDGDDISSPTPQSDHLQPQQGDDVHHKLRKRRVSKDGDRAKEDDNRGFFKEKLAQFEAASNRKRAPAPSDTGSSSDVDDRERSIRAGASRRNSEAECSENTALPAFLQLFPIHFNCDRAAVVMGNENTSAILVIKTQTLSGEIDAKHTTTPDPYRQVFRLHFQKPVVEFRDNDDYREDQTTRAVREKQIAEDTEPLPPRSFFRHHRRTVYSQLRNMIPYFRSSVESFTSPDPRISPATSVPTRLPGSVHWQGLSRYLDGPGGDEKTRWISSEYAMLNPILESPEAFLTLYWDSVGRVTASAVAGVGGSEKPASSGGKAHPFNINGNEPSPAWGMAFSIRGGSINYGPWADRKRAELQRVFFPGLSKDATPAKQLPVGAFRTPTQFKVYVELDDEVTLRVPLRESSKNWRFKGKEMSTKFQSARDKKRTRSRYKKSEPAPSTASQRPYGWLDIKIASNATVSYTMDMVASASGFASNLDLDLPRVEISSSVNQQVLWRSGALRTSCDLSTPLKWNSLRQWRFHITSNDLELFLLRDHVYLLTDLIDDWGTGPPSEYLVFTPFKYFIDLSFPNIKMFLNVNDANIINDPTSFVDNTFIILSSSLLEASVCIPLDKFRPPSNAIPFSVRTETASIRLHVPSWSTQHMFVQDKTVGHLKSLKLEGKYDYHAVTAPGNSDTLVLNVSGTKPTFNAYGFVVRYFLKLKDNYFGDDVHFKTLEEYQDGIRLKKDDPEAELATRPPHKVSNDLDVILSVFAEDPRLLLPAYIYSTSRHIQIDTASLAADMRFTNYYMDLDVVFPPLSLALEVEREGNQDNGDLQDPVGSVSSTQLFVDGLHVYGSRLFGLPPTEPTYLCNWDLSVGAITGECTTDFLTALASGGKAFGFTFDDDENALIPYHTIVMYDITFLRVNVKSVAIWLHVEDAAFLLSLGEGLDVSYNDWARQHYSKRGDISIPDLQISCVNSESAMRHKSRPSSVVETDAFFKTGLDIAIIGRKNDFSNARALQQALVRREDQRTQRAAFLIIPSLVDRAFIPDHVDPPAQPVPPIPLPVSAKDIAKDGISLSSSAMSVSSKRRLRRQKSQRSFLSVSASSQSSVVRPRSSIHTGSAPSRQSSTHPLGRQGMQPLTPMESHQGGHPRRAPSAMSRDAASSRQSGLFSIVDYAMDTQTKGPSHNTMAFSSKYFAPYFPLENVKPDISEAMAQGGNGVNCFGSYASDGDKLNENGSNHDDMSFADFGLEDVDPESLSEDRIHSSIMVRVREGISAFINPASAKHIATLLSALQPRDPDDILDTVQMASVDGIIGAMNRQKMKGRIEDIVLQLPRANLRFLNATSPDPTSQLRKAEQDQYDVSISNVTFMSREKVSWQNAMKPEENVLHNSFQLRLGSIEFTASERVAHVCRPQAAFMATVENVLVSMGTKDLVYLDANIEGIDGQLSSEKIEYIANLVHRTGVLASELGEAFSVPLSYSSQVRPHLAQRLIAAGIGVTDPGFLVRPSAVLRSAHDHLRTYDSWKLAMRLRQIWFLMKKDQKEQVVRECLGQAPLLPTRESPVANLAVAPIGGTVREVISKLEYWRGWDLGDLTRALFLQEMFSSLKADMSRAAAARRPIPAFMSVVRVERLQFALDPGPKQNETTLLDLTVRFENGAAAAAVSSPPQSPPATATTSTIPAKPTSVLNVYCSESAVRLNWEICELVEDVIRLYKRHMYEKSMADDQPSESKAAMATAAKDGKAPAAKNAKSVALVDQSMLHVVFAMDHGSLILDTINLHAHMKNQGMKSSLLLRHTASQVLDTNFITSCDFISTKVKSHSELIFWSELQRPSVFVAHDMQTTRSRFEHTINATASSRNFLFSMKQDPLALVETLDLLVKDEVAQLYQLSELFPLVPDNVRKTSTTSVQAKVKGSNAKIAERLSAFNFKVALFLEEYTISLPLLRSLAYKISGVVARVAMAATYGKEIIFDFDVKENSHEMQVTANNTPRSISLLQIPPTNGRITTRIGEHEQTVSVFSSLELVQLDAAAVYSLLSALNRPEISNTVADMQQQLKAIQKHVKEIFGAASQPATNAPAETQSAAKSKPPKPVIYSIHSTFAGLEIFSDVSLKSDPEPLAHLLFKLGSVRLEMTNRLDSRGPLLAYPELHINVRQTALEILKGSEEQMTSCGSMTFGALITASSKIGEDGKERRLFDVKSDGFDVSLSPDTVSTVVDVLGYMGDKIKDLDTSREMEYLRKLRQSKPRIAINDEEQPDDEEKPDIIDSFLSSIAYTFEVRSIQVNWLCALTTLPSSLPKSPSAPHSEAKEDLVLTLGRFEFGTRTKNSARLTIENLQLQMVPPMQDKRARSANSALLPEVVFNVAYFSTARSRRFAFQAVGKSLDLRLTSEFIVPAAHLKDSIELSIKNVQQVSRRWNPVVSPSVKPVAAPTTTSGSPGSPSKAPGSPQQQPMFGNKMLESLLVDVDFAGAVVYISGTKSSTGANMFGTPASTLGVPGSGVGSSRPRRTGIGGKYGQFTSDESGGTTILRSPGLAWKMEYRDSGRGDPSLYAEVKIDPSSNVLYPSVVPLVMDLTASIQEVVSKSGKDPKLIGDSPESAKEGGAGDAAAAVARLKPEDSILLSAANPNAMLGRLKLNLGIRIHRQQFTLSCQPIARVAATTSFDDVYLTVNTIQTVEHGNFVAVSGNITRLHASVQHVYSRESTGSFEVESIVLSLMNSKHVSGVSGVSALLKVSPMKVAINVRQVQDFMLFQEIWTPRDIRKATTAPIVTKVQPEAAAGPTASQQQSQQTVHLAQRYQQVAATAAFPWTASISIAALEINVDLGQALGKSVFAIEEFWVSSKKTSDWEQNLCLGFRRIGIDSTGRMSGFVALEDFKLRTSIEWPQREQALSKTPLIQASISFSQLRIKASFDYQAFLVADVRSMDFLMYNVRRGKQDRGDRLVAVFEGDAVQVFATTTSAAQGVALYQAFLRLVQERKANFATALREIEKFTNRRASSAVPQAQAPTQTPAAGSPSMSASGGVTDTVAAIALESTDETAQAARLADSDSRDGDSMSKSPISLDTEVVVTLRAVNLGVFPNTFADHQVFKMEALNAEARFAANIHDGRIHSNLGLTLGQLRIGLASVRHRPTNTTAPGGPPKTIGELSVDDVVLSATGSRGGTILKVPRVEAGMQTWQKPDSKQIDYIFRSAFEGKVEVGWNYSRISYIRGMWANHNRTFEQTWGRGLPLATIRVTGVPESAGEGAEGGTSAGEKTGDDKQAKITAEVHVPQSRFQYHALQPAVIETPQLRDMGEATPPLEWIGLHRDRLPNLTHQIVIVSLLELAGEVEDAYSHILGSS